MDFPAERCDLSEKWRDIPAKPNPQRRTGANRARTGCRSFAYLIIVAGCRGGHTTAVAEYPDNVEPNKQISKAPAPFWALSTPMAKGKI